MKEEFYYISLRALCQLLAERVEDPTEPKAELSEMAVHIHGALSKNYVGGNGTTRSQGRLLELMVSGLLKVPDPPPLKLFGMMPEELKPNDPRIIEVEPNTTEKVERIEGQMPFLSDPKDIEDLERMMREMKERFELDYEFPPIRSEKLKGKIVGTKKGEPEL